MDEKLNAGFGDVAGKTKPGILYHCIPGTPLGNAIEPRSNREANGKRATYLFATPVLSKSLAFAFSYYTPEIIRNNGIDGTDQEIALVLGGKNVMEAPRPITVYAFSSDGFSPLGNADETRQYVSEKPVPFDRTAVTFRADNAISLLSQGLQVFCFRHNADHYQSLYGDDFAQVLTDNLSHFYKTGELVWENKARHINPLPAAERYIDLWSAPGTSPHPFA